jgi:hypothetical protein
VPRSILSSNVRELTKEKRKYFKYSFAGEGVSQTLLAASANASVGINSYTTSFGLKVSVSSADTTDGDTGREARLTIFATGTMSISVDPEDNADRFVMIKRVSPIMPNPAPLDSKGKPT